MDALAGILGGGVDVFTWVGQWAMRVFSAIFVMVSAILFAGQFIYSQIQIKIAVMLMPIMVPFIMLEKTKFIFEGWFKFLITAGFTKIVGALLFGMLIGNIEMAQNLAQTAANANDGSGRAFSVYSTLMLITGLTMFMMLQTQQIGNALVSGFVQGGFKFNTMGWAGGGSRGGGAKGGGGPGGGNPARSGPGGGPSPGAPTKTAVTYSGQTAHVTSDGQGGAYISGTAGYAGHMSSNGVWTGYKGSAPLDADTKSLMVSAIQGFKASGKGI